MLYSGKINNIKKIFISDPSYEAGSSCSYYRDNLRLENCVVDIRIKKNKLESDLKCTFRDIVILIRRDNESVSLANFGVKFDKKNKINEIPLAMDSASIAFGINNYAEEIINAREEWQPACALKTLTDGVFGNVAEGVIDGQINFIYIAGFIDDDAGYSEKEIIDYLTKQLMIVNLQQIEESNKNNKLTDHNKDKIIKEDDEVKIVPEETLQL